MPRKPVIPEDIRQRSLEGPEEGQTRAKIRDVIDNHDRWSWLRGIIYRAAVVLSAIGDAIVYLRDGLAGALKLLLGLGH